MVLYKCERCCIEYTRKSTYTDHLKRKYPCKQIIILSDNKPMKTDEIFIKNNEKFKKTDETTPTLGLDANFDNNIINITTICCKFCNAIFKRKDYLKKHLDQSCKIKKQKEKSENNLFNKIAELEEKNKKMEEEINNLKLKKTKKSGSPNIIINNNGVINNNQINNQVNQVNNQITNIANFGTLDNKKIGDKIFYHTLTNFSGLKTFLKFIEYVHKNNKLKEYQNVEITDLGRNLGRICTNNVWAVEDANNISDKIIDESYTYYELKFEELQDDINEKPQRDKMKIKRNKRFIFIMKGSEMFDMNDDGDYVDDDGVKVSANEFKNGRKFEEKLKRQVKLLLKK